MTKEQFVPVKGVQDCEARGFKRGVLTEDSGKSIDPLVRSRYINATKREELVYMVKDEVVKKTAKVKKPAKKDKEPIVEDTPVEKKKRKYNKKGK